MTRSQTRQCNLISLDVFYWWSWIRYQGGCANTRATPFNLLQIRYKVIRIYIGILSSLVVVVQHVHYNLISDYPKLICKKNYLNYVRINLILKHSLVYPWLQTMEAIGMLFCPSVHLT